MEQIKTPEWVKHAVFYQIFPDRFARSPRTQHPPNVNFKPWGSPPEEQGFQGGDLRGIVDKLDYIQELGVSAIYLNPIFSSASNHRYHTFDYFQVDPLLGGDAALRDLLDAAHRRNMRVVLDGVFNHASRGFWPFHHILENGADSPYIDWFIIHDWPLQPYPKNKKENHNYSAWWDLPALPKLNTDNPAVQAYIFDVARYWLEFGIDGWRLDVPAEIDDDEFWREFRRVVKGVNPEAYICGEIWRPAERWLQGDMYDAVMNYVVTGPMYSFFAAKTVRDYKKTHIELAPLAADRFAHKIDRMFGLYNSEINFAQLNMLDSHDMARALWVAGDDKSALRLCVLFMMTIPGAPCIYYGDEIGMTGADDPYCREAFPWDDESRWDHELLNFYRQATRLRHRNPVLRTGSFETLHTEGETYAFRRQLNDQLAVVIFNTATAPRQMSIHVPDAETASLSQVWPAVDDVSYRLEGERLDVTVPAREALVLMSAAD
ncbi:MAG TPA: glycoside hydrolase family 13 protein [Anaerolineae bacterium]|nr:glycoside hydrolase family 13 protein [Anaerolineae bacterium]